MLFYLSEYESELTAQQRLVSQQIRKLFEEEQPAYIPEKLLMLIKPYFKRRHGICLKARRFCRQLQKFGFGPRVLFLGTDGTGKTTLINGLYKNLPHPTRKLYLGVGDEGWVWPWSKFLVRFLGETPFKFLRKWLVLPLEYATRVLWVYLKGRHSIILIDRYPELPLITNKPRKKLLQFILPQVDVVVNLTGDPKVIAGRKPDEIVLEDTVRNLKLYRQIAPQFGAEKVLEIDTTKHDVQTCVDLVKQEVYATSACIKRLYKKC